MPGINPVLAAASQVTGATSQAASALADINTQEQGLYDKQNTLNIDIGAQQQVIDNAQLQGKYQAEKDVNQFALSIGGDLGDTTGTLRSLADVYNKATTAQSEALKEVNAKRSVSLLDDPLGWIQAQLTINDSINKYNGAEQEANNAAGHIDTINKLISARGVADRELQSTVSDASIAAQSKKTADAALIASNNASLQALNSNAGNIEKLAQLSEVQLRTASTVFSAEKAQQEIGLAQQRLKIEQDAAAERLQNKKESDAFYAQAAGYVADGFKQLYPNSPEMQKLAASPAMIAALKNGKLDPKAQAAYQIGSLNAVTGASGSGNRLLAATPADMLQVLTLGPTISPAQRPVIDILAQAKTDLSGGPGSKAPKEIVAQFQAAVQSKDKVAQENIFNSYANQVLNAAAARVDGPKNPFSLPSISQIADQTPALKTFSVYQKVIAPAVKAGVDLSQPDTVLNLVIDAVNKGDLKMNDAASDLSAFYTQGQRINMAARTVHGFGFNPPMSYNVMTDTGSGSAVVNYTNPTEILNMMVKKATNAIVAPAGLVPGV